MMFRRLFFVAPLLVAGEVCEGDACYTGDSTAMLQLKGRDETKELLQRSRVDASQQTLRTLEENLMFKDGVDTSKCAYFLKTSKNDLDDSQTPCDSIDLLEQAFADSLKDFEKFDQIAKKTLSEVQENVKKSLTDMSLKKLPEAASNITLGVIAEKKDVENLVVGIMGTVGKMTSSQVKEDMQNATEVFVDMVLDNFRTTVTEVEEDIKKVLTLEDVTLNGDTFSASALRESIENDVSEGVIEAEKKLYKYIMDRFAVFMRLVGEEAVTFWKTVLHFPAGAEDPFEGLDWSEPKDWKKAEKKFWHLAQGFFDDNDDVEEGCKSESFEEEKPQSFAVRQICKSNTKPRCVDEVLYMFQDPDEFASACQASNKLHRKYRRLPFNNEEFKKTCSEGWGCDDLEPIIDNGASCKNTGDVRKACLKLDKLMAG